MKQKEVASKLNVTENNYSKWERGITDIPLDKVNDIANLYNCSLDYLFCLTDNNMKTDRKTIDLKLLSKRLLELRKSKKLTQEQLSDYIGYHQRVYAHYEMGNRIPTIFKVYYVALYYKISLDYLVGRKDDMKIK